MPNPDHSLLYDCIQKVATGPEYSKSLSFDEAHAAMTHILSGGADPVRAAIFLIALRMKRETEDENMGVLRALIDAGERVECEVDELVDIADPYNGMARGLPVSAFAAPLLAACGLPAFSHGTESAAPKFGITHKQVLRAAGVDVALGPGALARQIADPVIGWGYLDQSNACPALHKLLPLRTQMIKRTLITTLEVLMKPLGARRRTHLLTGYVHKAYPPTYAALAKYAGFETAAIVRGVEGGTIASLRDPAKVYRYDEHSDCHFQPLNPEALNVAGESRCVPIPDEMKSGDGQLNTDAAARKAAELGVKALQNDAGPARDSLVYCAALVLYHSGRCESLEDGAAIARHALESGAAFQHFAAHC